MFFQKTKYVSNFQKCVFSFGKNLSQYILCFLQCLTENYLILLANNNRLVITGLVSFPAFSIRVVIKIFPVCVLSKNPTCS